MGEQAADNVMGMINEMNKQRAGLNSGVLCLW
jgi:hypothetical protein